MSNNFLVRSTVTMTNPRFHGVFGSILKEKMGVDMEEQEVASKNEEVTEEVVEPPALKTGQIAVDVYEDGGYIVIKAPIAGVKLSDLDIDVADNVVTIRGERKQTDDIDLNECIVQECYWGPFSRRVELPHSVNPTKVRATFSKDNILKVFVPKDERKVKIVKINEGG